jgi:NADPH:quinone reductase-like Zn-dependent oxidoreductase
MGWFCRVCIVPEKALAIKPANLSFVEAAAVPMAVVTALQSLRNKGNIHPGQKVLINGASGGVRTFAVQIAMALGAEVTGVCSTRNLDILESIGADHCLDYTKESFTQRRERYDLILGINGGLPLSAYKRVLNPNGIFVHVGGSSFQMFQAMTLGPLISMIRNKKMGSFLQRANQQDLIYMKELVESGKVKPIIDRCYNLNELPDAFRYFERGHVQGKVVITISKRIKDSY